MPIFGQQAVNDYYKTLLETQIKETETNNNNVNNISFEVCLDLKNYKEKPQDSEIAIISNRISKRIKRIDSEAFKSFAETVGTGGQTFCPATFNGSRCQENFKQSQMLVLDFDNKYSNKTITWEQFKARAEKYELPVLFAYDTISSSANKHKFRAVFLNDASFTDIRGAKIIQKALMTIFPEADPKSEDVSMMYFGGKKLLDADNRMPTVNIESLIRNMSIYLRDEYGDTNYKRKIKKFAEDTGVALNEKGLLDIAVLDDDEVSDEINKNSPNQITIKAFGENLLNRHYRINFSTDNSTIFSANPETFKNHKLYRSDDIKLIRPVCRLFRDFEDGVYKPSHDELFALATTLSNIETGKNFFLDTIRRHSHKYQSYAKKYTYWDYNLSYMVQNSYKPTSCEVHCRYSNQCNHGKNIFSTAMPNGIEIIPNSQEKLYSLAESTADVKVKIENAIADEFIGVHVINAPTAIGKTEIILNIMEQSNGYILLAVPNNDLKEDVYARATEKLISVVKTPSLHQIKNDIPSKVWNKINKFYKTGRHSSVMAYIKKVLEKEDIPCLEEYLEDYKKFTEFNGHAITTHKRLAYMSEDELSKYNTVVIDEDFILNCFMPDKVDVSISDLKKLTKTLSIKSKLHQKINKLLKKIETESLFTLPEIDYDQEKNEDENSEYVSDDISMVVDISSFCVATHFCYRKASKEKNLKENCISFYKPMELNSSVKYIMLSATADENICRYFFSNYLRLPLKYDYCKRSAYIGKIYQYSDKSYSRACIADNPDIIEQIKTWTGFEYTITFKNHSKGVQTYFGKANGVDYLKGKNIDIIGTDHKPSFLYKLFAYTLGLDFDREANLKPKSKFNIVEYNGFRFPFTTYDDKILRDIQFWLISSELEQAVGRARLLRFDCSVNVFSDFPVSQSIFKKPEYETVKI